MIDDSVTSGSKSCPTDAEKQWLHQNKTNIVSFLVKLLGGKTQPQQDHIELIKLSLILLGKSDVIAVDGMVHFSPPGAYHRACWMAKGIYCLKMFLFREQFKLTTAEQQALRRICLFTVTISVKAWFTAPNTCDAPLNDLCLLQTLESFAAVDCQLSDAAMKKMKSHLWYLSEDLIGLALFSDSVCSSEKKSLVAALKKPKNQLDLRRVDPKTIGSFHAMTLSDYATEHSTNLFTALRIDSSCLDGDLSMWPDCPAYMKAKEIVSAVRVVNDCAEHAVKLATDFNTSLTQDEGQRRLIFQACNFIDKLWLRPQWQGRQGASQLFEKSHKLIQLGGTGADTGTEHAVNDFNTSLTKERVNGSLYSKSWNFIDKLWLRPPWQGRHGASQLFERSHKLLQLGRNLRRQPDTGTEHAVKLARLQHFADTGRGSTAAYIPNRVISSTSCGSGLNDKVGKVRLSCLRSLTNFFNSEELVPTLEPSMQ